MNISFIECLICSDLLASSDDVFITPCGHVFHYACLVKWLKRSKICPQCRGKTTKDEIRKIYFSLPNNDSVVKDAMTLQNRKKIEPEKLNQNIQPRQNLNLTKTIEIEKLDNNKISMAANFLRYVLQKIVSVIEQIEANSSMVDSLGLPIDREGEYIIT